MTDGGKKIRAAVGDLPQSPFAPLRPLLQAHEEDAADGLNKLATALVDFGTPVRMHVQILDGDKLENWTVKSGTRRGTAQRSVPKEADLRLVLRRATWLAIAQGRLSPFDALFAGRMRFGGNPELGKHVAHHLSDPSVPFVPPC